eukprot:TRINITY_DN4510_c0_g1_i2.p1 TRINITY_DN4510_c0_g1~~TRINITY_DN4510_c0_g1_i2.p1  ORF type:complete len:133 (+),score=7.83 TRINITY_DN4510_c0_g1_i2:1-399(+)
MRWAVLLITPNSFQNKFGVSYFKQNEVSIEYHSALFLLHPFNQKGEAKTKLSGTLLTLRFVQNNLPQTCFETSLGLSTKQPIACSPRKSFMSDDDQMVNICQIALPQPDLKVTFAFYQRSPVRRVIANRLVL